MYKTWEKLYGNLVDLTEELSSLFEALPQSKEIIRRGGKVKKRWASIQRHFREFNEFVAPVDPVEVKLPYDHKDFTYWWQFWKDYLKEQHSIYMRSRMELASLLEIVRKSENNPNEACKMIKYAAAYGYKKFFALDPEQKKEAELTDNADKDKKETPKEELTPEVYRDVLQGNFDKKVSEYFTELFIKNRPAKSREQANYYAGQLSKEAGRDIMHAIAILKKKYKTSSV